MAGLEAGLPLSRTQRTVQKEVLKATAELIEALDYCARMLEMACPDTAGTPAAQHAREVLAKWGHR